MAGTMAIIIILRRPQAIAAEDFASATGQQHVDLIMLEWDS